MKQLYYVPIIHTSADLGSLGTEVSRRGASELGEATWQKHQQVVEDFWESITRYFLALDVTGVKLYQDGMVADGEIGATIVNEGVKAQSPNYRLLRVLMDHGAILVRTEDFALAKEELDRLLQVTRAKSVAQKLAAFVRYRLVRDRLLDRRDRFIAQRIDQTLEPNQVGILFIGAYHNVRSLLARDITVRETKDTRKVREYHHLLHLGDTHRRRLDELGRYLRADVA
jgi:hypothetical protein